MPLSKYEGKISDQGKQQRLEVNNCHKASFTGRILEQRTKEVKGGFDHVEEDCNDI